MWAETFEQGIDLWLGVVPSTDATASATLELAARIETFFSQLGFDGEAYADRLVVTPTCGMAGASPDLGAPSADAFTHRRRTVSAPSAATTEANQRRVRRTSAATPPTIAGRALAVR